MLKNLVNIDVKKQAAKIQNIFLNQLLPPRCLSCGGAVQDTGRLCADCWKSITFLQGPACACCGYPFEFDPNVISCHEKTLCGACSAKKPIYDCARAAMRYDDGSRRMIISFKHGDRTDYADFFSQLLIQTSASLTGEDAIVVPVPLHKRRLQRRRYNQSALVARNFATKKGLHYIPDMLIRQKHTPPQEGNYSHRKRNVMGAFKIKPQYQDILKGREIILIDDVYTTGATVKACAHTLKRAGAAQVEILTIARVCQSI
ncbi:MAG: ComF family protein [Emcibacter sp.]|nr:ComF family protein [Emcibacter sp.]